VAPGRSLSESYGGGSVFCCLVLRGKHTKVEYKVGRPLKPGFDSHVSPCGQEWIMFDAAQVLPLYLVHGDRPAINLNPWPIAEVVLTSSQGLETQGDWNAFLKNYNDIQDVTGELSTSQLEKFKGVVIGTALLGRKKNKETAQVQPVTPSPPPVGLQAGSSSGSISVVLSTPVENGPKPKCQKVYTAAEKLKNLELLSQSLKNIKSSQKEGNTKQDILALTKDMRSLMSVIEDRV
jgi:hypothetical protein